MLIAAAYMDVDTLLRAASIAAWTAMIVLQRQPVFRMATLEPRHLDPLWCMSVLFAANRLTYVWPSFARDAARDMRSNELVGYVTGIILCAAWLTLSNGYRRDDRST